MPQASEGGGFLGKNNLPGCGQFETYAAVKGLIKYVIRSFKPP